MADEDYGEDAAYFFDDDDYLYVEDEYAIAVGIRNLRRVSGACSARHTRARGQAVDTKNSPRTN